MQSAHRCIGAAVVVALTACGPAPDSADSADSAAPAAAPAAPRAAVAPGDWPLINRDLSANRHSPLTEITAANVATLAPSWAYELGGNSTAVPIVVAGVMYLPSRDRVVALDGDTGALVWEFMLPAPPAPPAGAARPQGGGGPGGGGGGPAASTRGVSYWAGDGTSPPRILFMSRANLFALDAATGTPAAGFGLNGAVDVGVP
jgi:quinoprotein glucose dehydrogenase